MMFRTAGTLRYRGKKFTEEVKSDLPQSKLKQKSERDLNGIWPMLEKLILSPIAAPDASLAEFKKNSSPTSFGLKSVAMATFSAAAANPFVSMLIAVLTNAGFSSAASNFTFSTGPAPGNPDRCSPFLSWQCLQGFVTQQNVAALSEEIKKEVEREGLENVTSSFINNATLKVLLKKFEEATASSQVVATWVRTVTDVSSTDAPDSGMSTALRHCFSGDKMKLVLMQALGIQEDGSSVLLESLHKDVNAITSCPLTALPWEKMNVRGTIFSNGMTADTCLSAQNEFLTQLQANCETFDTQVNGSLWGLGIGIAALGALCVGGVAYYCCKEKCLKASESHNENRNRMRV